MTMKMGRKMLTAMVVALPLSLAACGGGTSPRPKYDEVFVNTQLSRLQSEDARERYYGARALGEVRHPSVKKAICPLMCMLQDEEPLVRSAAERAIRKIAPSALKTGRKECGSESPL